MKLTRISFCNYIYGDWKLARMASGLWLVWNVQTVTRTARDCPNSKWFVDLAAAKTYVLEQSNKAGI